MLAREAHRCRTGSGSQKKFAGVVMRQVSGFELRPVVPQERRDK